MIPTPAVLHTRKKQWLSVLGRSEVFHGDFQGVDERRSLTDWGQINWENPCPGANLIVLENIFLLKAGGILKTLLKSESDKPLRGAFQQFLCEQVVSLTLSFAANHGSHCSPACNSLYPEPLVHTQEYNLGTCLSSDCQASLTIL